MQCIKCKNQVVHVKKWKLCKKCYVFQRKNGLLTSGSITVNKTEIRHKSEINFIKNYFTHVNWFYQPAMFRFNYMKYSPDFYDGARGVFIEVVGCHQAYQKNKSKYSKFRKAYSFLKFEIRTSEGDLVYNIHGEKVGIIPANLSKR